MSSMKGRKTKKREDTESTTSLNKKKTFKFNSGAVPEKSFEVFDFSESASDKESRASFPFTTKRKVPTRSSAENERFTLNSKTVTGEHCKKRTTGSILRDRINIESESQNNRIENGSNKMDTTSNCKNKSDSLQKTFPLKENKLDKMKDENKSPNTNYSGIEDSSLPGPSKQQDSVFICPVCNQQLSSSLSLREKEIHINSCLDGGSNVTKEKPPHATEHKSDENIASSMQNEIWGKGIKSKQKCDCGKDLSGFDFLNVQSHLFQCKHSSTDSASLKTGCNKPKIKKSTTRKKKSEKKFCPICMKLQCNDDSKLIVHLRQCAVKHNVSTSKVLCLIKEIQWSGFKNKSKKKKKEGNTSVLIKYSSEIKDEVVNQMKRLQDAYKECTDLLESTPSFNQSKVDKLSYLNIRNTSSKLWAMTSAKINSDNSCLYLNGIHKDIHKTETEVMDDELVNIEKEEISALPKSDENIPDIVQDESVNVSLLDHSKVKNLDLNDKTILYSNSEISVDTRDISNDQKDVNCIDQSNVILDEKSKQSFQKEMPCQRGSSESSIILYCDQNSDQNIDISKDLKGGNGFIDTLNFIKELQTNSSKDLIENLSTLLEYSIQTDFLFKCKDNVDVKAHCLFLSFRCSYLKSLISSGTKELELIDVPADVVKIVLKYLYTGMLPSESENIEEIYKLSKKFSLSQLIEFCTFLKPELFVNGKSNDIVPDDESVDEMFYSPTDQNKDVGDDSCFSQDELDELQGLFQTQVIKEYSHEQTLNTNNDIPWSESDEDDGDSDDENSISSSKEGIDEIIEEEETSRLVESDVKIDKVDIEINATENKNHVLEVEESGMESCFGQNDENNDKLNMDIDVMDGEKDEEHTGKGFTENRMPANDADSSHSFDGLIAENHNDVTTESKNDRNVKNSLVSNETHKSLSEVFFNESTEQHTVLSKENLINKEEKSVTVLVSDSETDLDETLDVEPLVDEEEEQILDENEGKDQKTDEKIGACEDDNIIQPMSPCLANNNLFENDCSQIDAEITYCENSPKNLLNVESTPTKRDAVGNQEDATLKLTLNLTSNSPVALSFGTPFLSCPTPKVVENNNNMDNDTSLHPLDHAEATVIDEFAYEKLNQFLKETHEEPDKKQDKSSHSLVEEEADDKNNEASSCDKGEQVTLKSPDIKGEQVTLKSPEKFTQGFSIDFQISTADDLDNSIDIISTKEGDISRNNENQENHLETTDLLLGSNRKRETLDRKRETSAVSSKRNNSDCSDESVSSGNSQKNIKNFIQNRRKSKRKKISQTSRQKNVESRSSSDDDVSESDVPTNRSMLLKTSKISPRRSSTRKMIKTYSTTSPYVSKDNSWLSTKDSPNKSSINRSITRRVKGKKGNAFKEIVKQNLDQSSIEKGKSKKRTSFKDMVNQKNIDLSSTDESVSEDEEVTCISASHNSNNSKQPRNLIAFGDEDAIIEDMFRTNCRNTSKIVQMGLENENELSLKNVSIINESDDDDVQNFDCDKTKENSLETQTIDPPEVDNQDSNSSGKQDDCSFPANEYMDDFMDDGGYNSFVMNMDCLENNEDKSDDAFQPNDEGNVSICNQSLNKQEENNKEITNENKTSDNLMVSTCSIDDALINFQTPGQEKAISKSRLSSVTVSTPTNSTLKDEFQSSTPLEPDASMDEESRKELIEACKNFRPGFNIHPKTKEPITPMPDYSSLPTPKLKDEMKKYALRNIPKHKMIAKMKEIYKFQHEFDHWEEEAKKAPAKKRAKTKARVKENENVSEQTESDGKNTDSESNKGGVKGKGKKKLKNSKADHEDDKELKPSQIDYVSLEEKIMNYITSNPQLHHKILTYTPLEFLDLMTLLKSSEIKCSKKNLEIFLDKQCICYYTAKDEQQVPRRKKRKKDKASTSKEE